MKKQIKKVIALKFSGLWWKLLQTIYWTNVLKLLLWNKYCTKISLETYLYKKKEIFLASKLDKMLIDFLKYSSTIFSCKLIISSTNTSIENICTFLSTQIEHRMCSSRMSLTLWLLFLSSSHYLAILLDSEKGFNKKVFFSHRKTRTFIRRLVWFGFFV